MLLTALCIFFPISCLSHIQISVSHQRSHISVHFPFLTWVMTSSLIRGIGVCETRHSFFPPFHPSFLWFLFKCFLNLLTSLLSVYSHMDPSWKGLSRKWVISVAMFLICGSVLCGEHTMISSLKFLLINHSVFSGSSTLFVTDLNITPGHIQVTLKLRL